MNSVCLSRGPTIRLSHLPPRSQPPNWRLRNSTDSQVPLQKMLYSIDYVLKVKDYDQPYVAYKEER